MDRRRVLVAVDETDASRRAARFANDFFDDAEILAVSVARRPIPWPAPVAGFGSVYVGNWASTGAYQDWMKASIEEGMRTARGAVERSGVEADEELVEMGDPVDAISNAATEHDVALIVVGTNDKGFLERLLSGSVSEDLVREGPRPVLVVR